MKAYINGVGSISAQAGNQPFLKEPIIANGNKHICSEPDYKNYIQAMQLRRMSRILKMGVSAAQIALQDADLKMPDAIITGTGLGCIEDTEKFLTNVIQNTEQFLTPTSFIQSTHNTVGGQIALQLKCNNYNFTYVHRGFSFESCVLDALMLLQEKNNGQILIGGVDENTANSLKIIERLKQLKEGNETPLNLLNSNSEGTIAGEGANFFVLADKQNDNSYALLNGCSLIYKPKSIHEIYEAASQLLKENNLAESDIDVLLLGINGDLKFDAPYYDLMKAHFKTATTTYFKHLCGEFPTANSYGFYVASEVIKNQSIPETLLISNKNRKPKHLLLYNHYRGINQTLLLFSAC